MTRTPGQHTKALHWFCLWAGLIVVCHAAAWLSGERGYTLAESVERGAARVESLGVGEETDDVIRKAIQTQHATLPFWTAVAVIGDFVAEPMGLVLRAILVATLFASCAALVGRPVRFDAGLAACAALQGFWVLGIAFRIILGIALDHREVETSATLFLPPGEHWAVLWTAARQLDAFALVGWTALAVAGWRRRQVNLFTAGFVCLLLWALEAVIRTALILVVGAGMRLAPIVPPK